MLHSTDLQELLNDMQAAYTTETDSVKSRLIAKTAAMEVGGWTEECIDKIVTDFVDARSLRSRSKVLDRLKNVYGFNYQKEFRSLMVELVGTIGFERVEDHLSLKCQQLESALAELKQSRDKCAHTYTKPTMAIDAPNKMSALLKTIAEGLAAFSAELNNIRLQP